MFFFVAFSSSFNVFERRCADRISYWICCAVEWFYSVAFLLFLLLSHLDICRNLRLCMSVCAVCCVRGGRFKAFCANMMENFDWKFLNRISAFWKKKKLISGRHALSPLAIRCNFFLYVGRDRRYMFFACAQFSTTPATNDEADDQYYAMHDWI